MTFSALCESPRERHLRRSVPRSVFAALSLSAFIYFLAQMDRGFEILFARGCASKVQSRTWKQSVPVRASGWVAVPKCEIAIDYEYDTSPIRYRGRY